MMEKEGHRCYHCKGWVTPAEKASHACWVTTEEKLTADLSDELRDAWERLRETASDFGEQRIYASHRSIMFSRKACYFFVRPKRNALELCIFLGRLVKAPQIRQAKAGSKVKFWHLVDIKHRDEVEAPITDWLREAYEMSDQLTSANKTKATSPVKRGAKKKTAARKKAAKQKPAKKKPGKQKPAKKKTAKKKSV